jgi:hypothetical protein
VGRGGALIAARHGKFKEGRKDGANPPDINAAG